MSLTVREFHDVMESIAPSYLKESYDNVGLMVGDFNSEITNIIVALDCTLEVIKEAAEKKSNLILTHHPLLFLKPSAVTMDTLQGKKIMELIKNNINVYSSHTNLDVVKGGLNDIIAEILGFRQWSIIEPASANSHEAHQGVGRISTLDKPTTMKQLCKKVSEALKIHNLKYAGEDDLLISKVAVINGSGEDYFEAALKQGADCIITGDTSYHHVSDYAEICIGVIDAGHFETEWPSMKIFAQLLERNLKEMGFNNSVIISENCRSPYKFI